MKTEQEQIKVIKQIIDERVETTLGQVQGRHDNVIKTVDTIIIARDIVNAGYGDVSEYKAEIERLKEVIRNYKEVLCETTQRKDDAIKLNDKLVDEYENKVKQAQIDVLKRLKVFSEPYPNSWGIYVIDVYHIDELIEEVENETR